MSPGPRLDLHVHSACSPDGRVPIERLVAQLPALGLQGLALTDHNTTDGLLRLAALQRERPELLLVPGVEVSTIEGHLLVYGPRDAPPARRPLAEVLDWCRQQGAVAVPAHPFRRTHGVGGAIARTAVVPALEAINGHNGRRANSRAHSVATVRRLGTTGGSDAHGLADLGRAWTRFPDAVTTVEDVLRALGRGQGVGEGRSASAFERFAIGLRTVGLRLGRGLRPL
jgi:predicted metal-dependent phosphoesterase TrpH